MDLPGDKSISHRALLFAALASGTSEITNLLDSADVAATRRLVAALGARSRKTAPGCLRVTSRGGLSLGEPANVLDCGNSGTTARLATGLLGALPFFSVLTGDRSLRRRPMARVSRPLQALGVEIHGRQSGRYLPLSIRGRKLPAFECHVKEPSAQVKSALLLAACLANGESRVTQPIPTRDHTERMARAFGMDLKVQGASILVAGPTMPRPFNLSVPGDPSSAAFLIVAALLLPGSEVTLRGMLMNPSRIGFLHVLRRMEADLVIENRRELGGEEVADVTARSSRLKATTVAPDEIPFLVDEVPILVVAASLAEGTTTMEGLAELRIKESDRLRVLADTLPRLGANIREHPEALEIEGRDSLEGGRVTPGHDHRMVMALTIAAMAARGESTLEGCGPAGISFPGFHETLDRLRK